MADNKKGFILYADQKELFDKLTNDKAGKLIKHIFSYVNDENPKTKDLLIDLAFTPIKQQLKRDLQRWDKIRQSRSDAGKASAEARRNKIEQTSTKSTSVKFVKQNSTKSTVSVNVNDNVNVIKENIFPSFDEFWNLYDKKTGKPKSLIQWKKITQEEKELIMLNIPKYKNSKPDKTFRKDPERYLSNRTWEDDIINPKSQFNGKTEADLPPPAAEWTKYQREKAFGMTDEQFKKLFPDTPLI